MCALGYSVWALGAPSPRKPYTAEECIRRSELNLTERRLYAATAIQSLIEMQEVVDDAFGFTARTLVNADNLILTVSEIGQVFLGMPPLKQGVSIRNSKYIKVEVASYSLVHAVAAALSITICDAQHLVPDVGVAAPDEARKQILSALARLRVIQS